MPLAKHHEQAILGLDAPQFRALMTRLKATGIAIAPAPRKPSALVGYCKQPGDPALHPRDLMMPLIRETDALMVAVLEQLLGHKIVRKIEEARKRREFARRVTPSPRARREQAAVFTGDANRRELIVRLLLPNPHPPSSGVFHRYQCYRDGATVDECVTRGVRMCDVKFHERQGCVKLQTREQYQAEREARRDAA